MVELAERRWDVNEVIVLNALHGRIAVGVSPAGHHVNFLSGQLARHLSSQHPHVFRSSHLLYVLLIAHIGQFFFASWCVDCQLDGETVDLCIELR